MPKVQLTAAMTPSAIQETRPHSATTTALFGRVADSIREHGATPAQADAMTAVSRLYAGSDTPTAVAARNLARTAAEQVRA